jgi:hypothetical protein
MKHRERAFIAKCTPKKGKPWFAISSLRWQANEVRRFMTNGDPRGQARAWKLLKLDGWRVVRVVVNESN